MSENLLLVGFKEDGENIGELIIYAMVKQMVDGLSVKIHSGRKNTV